MGVGWIRARNHFVHNALSENFWKYFGFSRKKEKKSRTIFPDGLRSRNFEGHYFSMRKNEFNIQRSQVTFVLMKVNVIIQMKRDELGKKLLQFETA